jgi:hypothetical protein
MLFLVAFIFMLVLEYARRKRKEVLVQTYQYRLYALRDELREFAMENRGVAQNWVFQYMDSTIAKSIKLMPRLSIWFILGVVMTHRSDASLGRLRRHLEKEYEKPRNRRLKEIEDQFTSILGQYVMSRHVLMIFISAVAVMLPVTIASSIRGYKRRSLELIVESPETSTLRQFAPA